MIFSFKPEEKLILALDQMSEIEMFCLLDRLPDLVWVKVGLELFTLLGPEVIYKLRDLDKKVFLDLKFHDIPMTMAKACYQAAQTGAELITVHASAGIKGLRESNQSAIKGANDAGLPPPTLLAVTVLTSWDQEGFAQELAINQTLSERVSFFAQLAFDAGIGGCVCSPMEVNQLRNSFPEPFQLITPGIRSLGANLDDQVRVMTPQKALNEGSSKIVIGREITRASEPDKVFKRICSEMLAN